MNNECKICGGNGRLMRDKEPNANCPACGSEIYLPPEVKDGDLMDIINYSLEKEHHEWLIKHIWIVIAFHLLMPLIFVAGFYLSPDAPAKLPGFSTLTDICITIGLPTLFYIIFLCWTIYIPQRKVYEVILSTSFFALAIAAIILFGNWYTSNHSQPKQPAEITANITSSIDNR